MSWLSILGYSALAAVGIVVFYALYIYLKHSLSYIPGIPIAYGYPVLGTALDIMPINGNFFSHEKILNFIKNHGPIVQTCLFDRHLVFINDGQVLKQAMESIKDKGAVHRAVFAADNIFCLPTNPAWKRRRQGFRHAFTSATMQSMEQRMLVLIDNLRVKLDRFVQNQSILPLDELFGEFTLDTLYELGFEYRKDFMNNEKEYNELCAAVNTYFQYTWVVNLPMYKLMKLLPSPPGPIASYLGALKTVRKFQEELLTYIRQKHVRNELSNHCFAKLLLDFAKEESLTEEEIYSELFVFIVAGHETTAHSLSWVMYALMKDESLQKKCQQIMHEELATHTPVRWEEYCKRLPAYLEAVVKESMRRYPTVSRGSLRVVLAEEGVNIPTGLANRKHYYDSNKGSAEKYAHPTYPESVCIPKKSWIVMNLYALHNSTDNWGEDAEDFKPERWLGNPVNGVNLQSPSSFAGVSQDDMNSITFAPFSYGARNCIGMNMAMMEIRLVFAVLLSSYHFTLAKEELRDTKKALLTDFTMKPKDHLPVYVSKLSQ